MKGVLLGALVLALLGGMTACDLPDYQLAFELGPMSNSFGITSIDVYLENVGWKDLKNAQVEVSVYDSLGNFIESGWTDGEDLSVGDSETVTIEFDDSASAISTAVITAVGWDTSDDNTWE